MNVGKAYYTYQNSDEKRAERRFKAYCRAEAARLDRIQRKKEKQDAKESN